MKIKFLGGAEEVGKLGMFVEIGDARLLFDYGFKPGKPPEYPIQTPDLDAVFLSHAHLDHSGMTPWVAGKGTSIVGTVPTKFISEILFHDTLKINAIEGWESPWNKHDVRALMKSYHHVFYDGGLEIKKASVNFHSAGHIPGAMMCEISGDGEPSMLFTSDLSVRATRLVWGAHPIKCDVLAVEATYSGREHRLREQVEKELLDKIDEVRARGGRCIVPAFAVGRTQELLLVLRDSGFETWLDGMGSKITDIMLETPEYLRDSRKLSSAYNRVNVVRTDHGRKRATKYADAIVTSSGMLDGGPVLSYLRYLKDNPKNAVLLTGFQVPGSNGRRLLDAGSISFLGVNEKVSCEVQKFDFSAHAGHSEIVEFAKACRPEKIILYHSDDRAPLAEALKDVGEVVLPKNGEEFSI